MAIANELKIGNIVTVRGGRFKVVKTEHVKPGKGGAFIQAELKNIQTGSKLNERFRSDENVDIIFVETRKGSFMYDDGSSVVIMLSETFEQFETPHEIFGDSRYFLNDTMEITLELIGEEVVNARIPLKIEVEIDWTEVAIKNQTASASYKPAVLKTTMPYPSKDGFRISVPPFIETGEIIMMNTESFEYIERKK